MHRQTLYALSELQAMAFGLEEFKQLLLTISEIAKAYNISAEQAVSRSLKDVEEQYNDKPGFEGKVNEKRNEPAQLNNHVNYGRLTLLAPHSKVQHYSIFSKWGQ
jgi:hypothetical protein